MERQQIENPMIAEKRERRQVEDNVVYYKTKPPFAWMEDDTDEDA